MLARAREWLRTSRTDMERKRLCKTIRVKRHSYFTSLWILRNRLLGRWPFSYPVNFSSLPRFRASRLEEFCKAAPEKCKVNLNLPLLRRNAANQTLEVNFDDQLVEVLREVHYLLNLSGETVCAETAPEVVVFGLPEKIKDVIPPATLEVYRKTEPLRESRMKLGQIQNAYNAVRQQTLAVEYPLIADEVDQFDTELSRALKTMTWESGELIGVCFGDSGKLPVRISLSICFLFTRSSITHVRTPRPDLFAF